jgi:hypothetical protein
MKLSSKTIASALFGWLLVFGAGLQAHELRPSYLQIKELDASTYDVL